MPRKKPLASAPDKPGKKYDLWTPPKRVASVAPAPAPAPPQAREVFRVAVVPHHATCMYYERIYDGSVRSEKFLSREWVCHPDCGNTTRRKIPPQTSAHYNSVGVLVEGEIWVLDTP